SIFSRDRVRQTLLRACHRVDEAFYAVSAWASSPRDCRDDPSATRRHVALPRIANLEPREAKPVYADSSCASAANPSSSSGVPPHDFSSRNYPSRRGLGEEGCSMNTTSSGSVG